MSDWKIALLHTRPNTLLKRVFEAAFPGRVRSIHAPALRRDTSYEYDVSHGELLDYFRKYVYDPGFWDGRILTVYGDGEFHHYTYALTKLAAERRGLDGPERNWTYFHFDNHRDDWGKRAKNGTCETIDCASFVDSIAYHHGAVPFFVGPDAYPYKDAVGYRIRAEEIPIYSNYFTKKLQRSRNWAGIKLLPITSGNKWEDEAHGSAVVFTGGELPAVSDLHETPEEAYLSFDLDYLSPMDIVTNFPQNDHITTRRVCKILDRVRPRKRVFSADILGFPDNCRHPLSALTMVILAKKIMGLGVEKLLQYQDYAKRRQALWVANTHRMKFQYMSADGKAVIPALPEGTYPNFYLSERERKSPIEEGELLEVLR